MASKLRELRGNKSIYEVAKAIGITPQALSNYELGKRTPRDAIKIKIAEYYKRSIKNIFFADNTNLKLSKEGGRNGDTTN